MNGKALGIWNRNSILLGCLLWFASVSDLIYFSFDSYAFLFLLAPLIIVPVGLQLVATPNDEGLHPLSYRLAVGLQPFGAAFAMFSFDLDPGVFAGALALPWLVVVSCIAWFGMQRFLTRGLKPLEELAIDSALVYIVVGGGWFVFARFGIRPLQFSPTIVVLTAIHFHFAGFAAPLFAGFTGRSLDRPSGLQRFVYRGAAWGMIMGPPLVALGITVSQLGFSRLTELVCAVILALSVVGMALLVLTKVVPRKGGPLAKTGLVIASLSVVFTMCLACVYAYGRHTGNVLIDIPGMVRLHGILNALGFGLFGIMAWYQIQPKPKEKPPAISSKSITGR
mgnify:CR=1 FL=1